MSKRFARRLVRLYPRAWRARYEDEFVALLDARGDLTLSDVLDVARGAFREWGRSIARLAQQEPTDLPGLRRQARLQLVGAVSVALVIDLMAQAVTIAIPEAFRTSWAASPGLLYFTLGLGAFRSTWVVRSSIDDVEAGIGLREYGLWLLSLFACDVLAHLNLPKESLLDGWFWQWMSKPVVTLAIFLSALTMSTRSARRRLQRLSVLIAARRRSRVPAKPLDL